MQPNVKLHSIFTVITTLIIALGLAGCAGPKPVPPYFKEIYESSKSSATAPAAGRQTGDQPVTAPVVEVAKPLVKIISIPNPLQQEVVKAAIAKSQSVPTAKPEDAKASEGEAAKPLELSTKAAVGDVQVIVENMPVYDFINLAFGEILKVNYTVAQDIQSAKEKISLNMGQKMASKEFFPFLIELLRKNNLEVTDDHGILSVQSRSKQASQAVAPASEIYVGEIPPGLPSGKRITLIKAGNYVAASQILQIAKLLQLGNEVKSESLPATQAMYLSGTVASLEKVVALFNQLDRTSFSQKEFKLIYFDYINVIDFEKKMKDVLPATGIPVARIATDPGLLTIPFEKINALLVISSRKEWIESLLSWKDKLDAVESMGDEMQLFIYQPQNRPAEELVEVLRAISGSGSGSIPGATTSNAPASATSVTATQQPAKGAAPSSGASPAVAATATGKSFTAIVDKGRNALIISASPSNFKLIRNILMQLDTQPKQILIEATIAEVTLTDQFQFGVEWFIKHTLDGGKNGTFDGTLGTLGGLALGGTGLNYAITQLGGDFTAKLNMFAKQNLINIVSTPHIVMLDGKEAYINVGTEVPIVTAETSAADITSSSSTPSILRSIQYRNTGVILRVKPVVNAEGILTVDIGQELSEAQNNSVSSIDSPLILNRSLHTVLSVKSGDTVLLGGLISTNKSDGESKVPFFGDLPLIGRLFKTASTGNTKTELIIQLTPYILNSMDQLEEITKKFKDNVFLK